MKRRIIKKEIRELGYKSGLEYEVSLQLKKIFNVDGEYEENKIEYSIPETYHKYTPDFRLPNGIYIECKGLFQVQDQHKHLFIKEQHPELDIRFVFQNSKNKIRKGSKYTYADWCKKHGFKYSDKVIPKEWVKEKKQK